MPQTNEEKLRVAEGCLGPHDRLRKQSPDLVRQGYEVLSVTFRATEHEDVISIDVYADNTFKVGGSSTVPTHRFAAYAGAYSRSLAFVAALCLVPQL